MSGRQRRQSAPVQLDLFDSLQAGQRKVHLPRAGQPMKKPPRLAKDRGHDQGPKRRRALSGTHCSTGHVIMAGGGKGSP